MARKKTRRIWTVCYILYNPEISDPDESIYTNSWFAYGCTKDEAKEDFLRYFERERENFWCGDDERWQVHVSNVVEGFSC